jgi:glycosyltransferase involved in cell wall biosynthesis
VAVSHYNETELAEAGYQPTAVVPLLIDMTTTGEPPDRALGARLAAAKARGGADLLYVGKISPHKAPHDLVKMFSVYRRLYDPAARLHLVGSPLGDTYGPALTAFIDRLGLAGSVSVTGSVTKAELEAYFAAADVYVSASNHEGFCVPLVEAMGHGLPVVAYGVAAVPETVGAAGLLLANKSPLRFAAAVDRVVHDAALRATMVAAGAERVAAYDLDTSCRGYAEVIGQAVGAGAAA